MKYYIYHVPGVKIGCSKDPEDRVKRRQGFTDYEILEEHTDIYVASHREIELQKEYGYDRDCTLPYYVTVLRANEASRGKGGRPKGSKLSEETKKKIGKSNTITTKEFDDMIRAEYATGTTSYNKLRLKYGIGMSTVQRILKTT